MIVLVIALQGWESSDMVAMLVSVSNSARVLAS